MTERATVNILQASEIVGVSQRTIYNWVRAGKVEYTRTAGGSIRIFEDSLWRPGHQRAVTPADVTPREPIDALTKR